MGKIFKNPSSRLWVFKHLKPWNDLPVHMKNIHYMDPYEFKSMLLLRKALTCIPSMLYMYIYIVCWIGTKFPLLAEVSHIYVLLLLCQFTWIWCVYLMVFICCLRPFFVSLSQVSNTRWMHGLVRCRSGWYHTWSVCANVRHALTRMWFLLMHLCLIFVYIALCIILHYLSVAQ